jgi:hypothetical protein
MVDNKELESGLKAMTGRDRGTARATLRSYARFAGHLEPDNFPWFRTPADGSWPRRNDEEPRA